MVAARLPKSLVSDIKKIEDVEQTDRSTILRKTPLQGSYGMEERAGSKALLRRKNNP
jgi:hypothetical protein